MKVPVLLVVYNRDKTLIKVLDSLKEAGIQKLYIASDGANIEKIGDQLKVDKVREIIKNLNWDCEIKYLIRDENVGCKLGVSSAIDWFFEFEESGIILEDDCLPNESFWIFCELMLKKYKDNERIMTISGTNSQNGIKRGGGSYYFSNYNHVWGWATWRRAWKNYDGNIEFWQQMKYKDTWKNKFKDKIQRKYWEDIFDQVYSNNGKWDAWDYPWTCCIWNQDGINIMPNDNLVTNIGFGPDATHTKSFSSEFANLPTKVVKKFELKEQEIIEIDEVADLYTFNKHFGGEGQRTLKYKIKRKIKKILNSMRII
jgi:hypothetical protein